MNDTSDTGECGSAATQAIALEAANLRSRAGVSALGVCGLGGSGKSTACRAAARMLSPISIFEIDWFSARSSADRRAMIQAAIKEQNTAALAHWEDPTTWYDWPKLTAALSLLKSSRKLRLAGCWRQSTGELDLAVDEHIPTANGLILVEGIYLLHQPIRALLDRVIMLDAGGSESRDRANKRDTHRSDASYLSWKAELAERFDRPYFISHSDAIDRTVRVD